VRSQRAWKNTTTAKNTQGSVTVPSMAVVVMAILVVVKEGVKSCVCGAGIRGSGGLVLGY